MQGAALFHLVSKRPSSANNAISFSAVYLWLQVGKAKCNTNRPAHNSVISLEQICHLNPFSVAASQNVNFPFLSNHCIPKRSYAISNKSQISFLEIVAIVYNIVLLMNCKMYCLSEDELVVPLGYPFKCIIYEEESPLSFLVSLILKVLLFHTSVQI